MRIAKGHTDFKIIKHDTPQFDVEGMLHPIFYNQGNTIAIINGDEVYPDETFSTPEMVIQEGTFSISFKVPDNFKGNRNNKVKVNFTKITGYVELKSPEENIKC